MWGWFLIIDFALRHLYLMAFRIECLEGVGKKKQKK
jgi:hypothetical protein